MRGGKDKRERWSIESSVFDDVSKTYGICAAEVLMPPKIDVVHNTAKANFLDVGVLFGGLQCHLYARNTTLSDSKSRD